MSALEYLIESLKKIDTRSVTLILEGIEKKQEENVLNMDFSDNYSFNISPLKVAFNDFEGLNGSNHLDINTQDMDFAEIQLLRFMDTINEELRKIININDKLYALLVAMYNNLTKIQSEYNSLRTKEIAGLITECDVDLGDSDDDLGVPNEELQNRIPLLGSLDQIDHIDFGDASLSEIYDNTFNTPLLGSNNTVSQNTPTPSNTNDKSNGKCKLAIGTSLFFAGAGTGTAVGLAASGKIAIPALTGLVAKMMLIAPAAIAASPVLLGITAGLLGAAIVGLTGLVLYGVYKAWKNTNCCKSDDSEQTQDDDDYNTGDDTYVDPLGPTNGGYYQRH